MNHIKKFFKFYLIAHRGSPLEYPENTIESFRRALEIDKNFMLELDVWETSDNSIVVIHDELLEKNTDAVGHVKNFSLIEIKKLDAGYNISFDNRKTFPFRGKGYRIASLEDVLKTFPDKFLSIDIKYNNINFAGRVIDLIKKYDSSDRIIIGSFHDRITGWVKKTHPEMITFFRRSEIIKFLIFHKLKIIKLYKPKDNILNLPASLKIGNFKLLKFLRLDAFPLVTKKFIRDAHKKGIPVFVWTVNETAHMSRLIDWEADGIVTDFPDRLKQLII